MTESKPDCIDFTVAGHMDIKDLHGDISDPELVIFFNGNQYFATDELVSGFRQKYAYDGRIFWETLPPGILIEQIRRGCPATGNFRIGLKPDILTAGLIRLETIQRRDRWFARIEPYARNDLVIMVRKGNPLQVSCLQDLGRDDIRLSLPDKQWEGIGKLSENCLKKAGGSDLLVKVMEVKVRTHQTFITQIHHRQTPERIISGLSDAGIVWRTECLFQKQIEKPVDMVEIPVDLNPPSTLAAAIMANSPNAAAAVDFIDFLTGPGGDIYTSYGFKPVSQGQNEVKNKKKAGQ